MKGQAKAFTVLTIYTQLPRVRGLGTKLSADCSIVRAYKASLCKRVHGRLNSRLRALSVPGNVIAHKVIALSGYW